MGDLIVDALSKWSDDTERSASGEVNGHTVTIKKVSYKKNVHGETGWKIKVFVNNEDYRSAEKAQLSADEAQEEFEKHVTRHGLNESVDC